MSMFGISNQSMQILANEAHSAKGTLSAKKLSSTDIQAFSDRLGGSSVNRAADNTQENLFAEIKVSGKVVAQVWESGLVKLTGPHAGLANELNQSGAGTQLAHDRAEQIARVLKGEISYTNKPNSYTFSESLTKLLSS